MTVTLSPELEKLIQDRLASGRYHSPEDVLSSALWLLSARDHLVEQRKEELRYKVAKAREAVKQQDESPL